MSNNTQTQLLEAFKAEVLIQNQFFAYDTLVKWLHKNEVQEFGFKTKTDRYLFRMVDNGIVIYNYTIDTHQLTSKKFASFKEYLPEKIFYQAPETLEITENA
jgi:hypothetical protein